MSLDFDRVDLAEVSKHFGRRRAVSRINLRVQRGDVLGLLGPNGAGKSTLLGLLASLVTPSSGTIRYGERPVTDALGEVRGRIGLLAHELHLYTELTARQNLEFFARLHGLDARALVSGALEAAGLADRADDAVAGFSRGMRQRLALERALLHRPRLVLMDEPFTGLDDRAVGVVADRMRVLAAAGSMVVMATHDLDVAEGLVTRVAIIRDGRVMTDDTAHSGLRGRYRSIIGH